MEFGHVRGRDGYSCEEDQDQEQDQSLIPSSSTGAEAAMAATCSNIEKEHMFDKVVTPSDVGKLNRLVIPKQHAERYFPLDPSSNEKGLLLNFEDRSGKMWRFRYSYWNSSQSYVMTKGWSRFVKEKRLDAGDTVSFSRSVGGENLNSHLFIDWKRRPEIREPPRMQPRIPFSMQPSSSSSNYPMVSFSRSGGPWGSARLLVPNDPNATMYNQHQQINYGYTNAISPTAVPSGSGSGSGQYLVFRSAPPVQMQPAQVLDATLGMPMPMVLDSVPVANSQQAAAKRVRLFGVNLDFQESDGRSQNAGTQPSSSSSPSGKEEQLSLDLDM